MCFNVVLKRLFLAENKTEFFILKLKVFYIYYKLIKKRNSKTLKVQFFSKSLHPKTALTVFQTKMCNLFIFYFYRKTIKYCIRCCTVVLLTSPLQVPIPIPHFSLFVIYVARMQLGLSVVGSGKGDK